MNKRNLVLASLFSIIGQSYLAPAAHADHGYQHFLQQRQNQGTDQQLNRLHNVRGMNQAEQFLHRSGPTFKQVEPRTEFRQNQFYLQPRLQQLGINAVPIDLNLRSTRRMFVSPNLSGTVSILSGRDYINVDSNTKLTAAQAMAVHQVLYSGGQTITLGQKGEANGGTLKLTDDIGNSIESLNIPKGMTVVADFSQSSLDMSGNFVNHGSFYAVTQNQNDAVANIHANNIHNSSRALVTTVLPTGFDAGIANPVSSVDLALDAAGNIINMGTVSSSGKLTATAGGAIVNAPAQNAIGDVAAMTAVHDVNLQSNTVINYGLISSALSNINIATIAKPSSGTASGATYLVDGTGGTFSATNGTVTVGNSSLQAGDTLQLIGGNYDSKHLCVQAGDGSVQGHIGRVTGTLNTTAGKVYFGASTDLLQIGSTVITGDPTFFNDAGSISIDGDLIFPESIAILASGDVKDSKAVAIITADPNGGGRDITIIAGANLVAAGGAKPNAVATKGNQITQGTVTVNGPSATGGLISLQSSVVSTANKGGQPSGNLTLIAFEGSGVGSGSVTSTAALVAGGGGPADSSGNVTILAGASSGTAVNVSQIIASGAKSGGNILISNSQPSGKATFDQFGAGTLKFKAGKTLLGAEVKTNTVVTSGGSISISTGGQLSYGASGGTTQSIQSAPGLKGGAITLTGGSIVGNGALVADGANGLANSGAAGGAGGAITLTATDKISTTAVIQSLGGIGATGLTGSTPVNPDGSAGGNGGAGGAGGAGGKVSIETKNGPISLFVITNNGGAGGTGGIGGDGADSDVAAGTGGAGGAGGAGGKAGQIDVRSASAADVTLGVNSIGGDGGSGGSGGRGGSAQANGANDGAGGAGGISGKGGDANKVTVATDSKNLTLSNVFSSRGGTSLAGGDGGNGGFTAGFDSIGGVGGAGGASNSGGKGGKVSITLSKDAGSQFNMNTNIGVNGGDSIAGGNGGGGTSGGSSVAIGGNGGLGGNGGKGGVAGKLKLSGGTVLNGAKNATASGGMGGKGGNGGAGGDALDNGGNGGNSGNGGAGAKGGSISLSLAASIAVADGGKGGQPGTAGGKGLGFVTDGVDGTSGVAGADGKAGKVKNGP